jgi:hypothetical protein
MTGTVAALVAIAVVCPLALFAWLGLVFNAAAHPPPRVRRGEAAPGVREASAHRRRAGAHQEQAEEPSRSERRAA